MKKIILVMTAVVIAVSTYAQSEQKLPVSSDTTGYQQSNQKHSDGYMMKGGKMMCVKDQKMTLLKNDTTLTNGTIIMTTGDYVRKGETKQMFKEGQHMDLTGKIVPMTKSNDQVVEDARNKRMYLVTDTIKNKKN